jgi:alpha-mannosidase
LPGANKQWFTATEWAAVHDSDFAAAVIPVDAPLVTFGDIVRGTWPTEFSSANGTIFSWVMNNYWGTNFLPWQGGDFQFRYVVTSSRTFDPETLTRFGRQELTPLEPSAVAGVIFQEHAPPGTASFLSIDNPSLAAVTWKTAEDGDGTILRLQNISSKSGTATIHSDLFQFAAAWSCTLLEENQTSLAIGSRGIEISFEPYEIVTIRLRAVAKKQGGAARLAAR